MSKLNKDILFLLFNELQDDSNTLFSCLLVNRLWCETVIPTLWKNPWRYENNINYQKKISLYYIITFYLPNNIKEYLTRQEIQLPTTSHQSPLFDYLSFCRSINVNVINSIISIGSSSTYNKFIMQQEVYNIFMTKCPELKYLDMRSISHQLFYFPEARVRLGSLCELKCDTSIDYTYFYGLSHICHYIQRLIIFNTEQKSNHGIVKLIEVQKNLKYFEWKDDFVYDPFMEDNYDEFFLALTKKANTLNHLIASFHEEFEYTFSPHMITKFHNLRTLKLNFNSIDFDYSEELTNSVYHNLEIFKIDYTDINTVICIIKNSRGYLREILINEYYFKEDVYEDSLNFIRTVYENCQLIECLSLVLASSAKHFSEFEKLLKCCTRLKTLSLNAPQLRFVNRANGINGMNSTSGRRLLEVLTNSSSTNLREIRFFDGIKFSLETLEEFLENWRGRPMLTILTYDRDWEKEEYRELINKYRNDGVIKYFSCVNIYF